MSTTTSRMPTASSDAAAAASAETSLLAKQLAMADRARAAEHEQVLRLERMAEAARAQEAELAGRLRHAETQVAEALHDRARFDAAREEVERQLEAARAALEAARADAARQRAETAEAVGRSSGWRRLSRAKRRRPRSYGESSTCSARWARRRPRAPTSWRASRRRASRRDRTR